MGSISDKEKGRRRGKEMHEVFDKFIGSVLNDEEFGEEILRQWAKSDPKGFMQLAKDRMPKVQPVDQDLQKTYISLKSMMEELPDVTDIALALSTEKQKCNKLRREIEILKNEIKILRKKFL